jgi:uncharacterized protein
MSASLPQPESNGDSRPYWAAAREGRLRIRACKACGARHFMPRHLCPECWSDQLEWIDSKGQGTVHSFSIVHRAPTPDFGANTPYVIAMIDLAEGPRMFANVVGEGAHSVAIGDAVQVTFEDRGDGFKIPQFNRVVK